MSNKVAVIAIGGNSLIKDKAHQSVQDQYDAADETSKHIAKMIKQGWNVAIAHGNGPQIDKEVATVVTQVEVGADDPAFKNPTKPIGSFMDEAQAMSRRENDGWDVVEDAGRGWRRVVASPLPKRIVEETAVKHLIDAGVSVITVGGGGIPVVAKNGKLQGVAAVIDKDFASALLANQIDAELFIISTAVEKVALNFGKENQQWLDEITLAEAKAYLAEGIHFAKGSMAPKIQAAIKFLERGGHHVIITDPQNIARALNGETGTHIKA